MRPGERATRSRSRRPSLAGTLTRGSYAVDVRGNSLLSTVGSLEAGLGISPKRSVRPSLRDPYAMRSCVSVRPTRLPASPTAALKYVPLGRYVIVSLYTEKL
jgi:hypothetical protein